MKFTVDIKASRMKQAFGGMYGYTRHETTVPITEKEIFEALSKYCQVKKFDTEVLSVTKED